MIYESGENYLETILILRGRTSFVRLTDIARELNYSKASISRALGILKKDEYIFIEADGNIVLTELGLAKAQKIYEKHQIITKFLTEKLGVSDAVAEEDACRMEHIISEETFEKIKDFI